MLGMARSEELSGAVFDVMTAELRAHRGSPVPPVAFDNFARVFAIRPDDRVLLLLDHDLDSDVVHFIQDFARGRGAEVRTIAVDLQLATQPDIPEEVKPSVEWATFVVSTWFSSISHPFFVELRRDQGQRWVKISYFRSLDLLYSEAASFPLDVIRVLLQTTRSAFQDGDAAVYHITDDRGTDLTINMPAENVRKSVLSNPRLQGDVTADNAGTYVHYLATHGPNIYENSNNAGHSDVNGIIIPQWSVGFVHPFDPPITIEMVDNRVVAIDGKPSKEKDILTDMLMGSRLIELGLGFNPKWPRDQLYPGGSNSPGAVHFGMDLVKESSYIKRTMPSWNEPPVHMDLVDLDATITVNGTSLVENGFLLALRDKEVVQIASKYGPPEDLLENWPYLSGSLLPQPQ